MIEENIADRWVGLQAQGAFKNGSMIQKCNTEPGDSFPDGTLGRVVGSIDLPPNPMNVTIMYVVQWIPAPNLNICIANKRVKLHEPTPQ